MKVIKVKAKVLEVEEDQMEAESKYDLGNIAKNKDWVWRDMGMEVYEIYRIVEYNNKMSIIITMDDEKILIKEPFDELFTRWEKLKEPEPEPEATKDNFNEETADEEDDEDDN